MINHSWVNPSSAKQTFNGKKMSNQVERDFSDYGTHANPSNKPVRITLPSVWDRVAAGDVSDFAGEATKLTAEEPTGYGESTWGEVPDEQVSRWESEGGR